MTVDQTARMQMSVLQKIHQWDVDTFLGVASHLHERIVRTAYFASKTGDGWLYPVIPFAILWSGFADEWFLLTCASAFAIERLVYFAAKNSFKRRRPGNIVPGYSSHIIASDEFSFPSGHTSASFLMVTLIVIEFGIFATPLYLWALVVCVSRIILGVHFPTDIMVGCLMGSGIALATYTYLIY
tara:strand:+ start:8868 stop:9419 length:552 start_codon:yes stop_codon:yes gene_type:complete